MKTLLFVLLSVAASGQAVFLTEQGYLIPKREDFKELEYLARNGKLCLNEKEYYLKLTEQIRQAKMQSDSNVYVLQLKINELRQKSLDKEAQFVTAKNKITELEGVVRTKEVEISGLKTTVKKQKWQITGYKLSAAALTLLGGYLILK